MAQTVTLIPGDGITSELVGPVTSILDAAGAEITFETVHAGRGFYATSSGGIPEALIDSIKTNGVALKGKLLPTKDAKQTNPNSELRRRLGLFSAVRPIRNLPGLPSRHDDIDIVLVRETSEDVYAGLEHQVREGVVASLKVVTAKGCARITRFAFEYARRHGRKKVSLIHKANIMKVTDGLFIKTAKEVAADYDDIAFNTLIVDNACMQLLQRPHQYDIILTGNLYGDIMSDLGAGIVGGISASYGASVNEDIAIFECIHGDAPDLIGKDSANPLPMLMPAVYMLEHLEQRDAATRIRDAISATLKAGVSTVDLGGTATTSAMTEAIIGNLA